MERNKVYNVNKFKEALNLNKYYLEIVVDLITFMNADGLAKNI